MTTDNTNKTVASEAIVNTAQTTKKNVVKAYESDTLAEAKAAFDTICAAFATEEAKKAYKQVGWLALNLVTLTAGFFGKNIARGWNVGLDKAVVAYTKAVVDGDENSLVVKIDDKLPEVVADWVEDRAAHIEEVSDPEYQARLVAYFDNPMGDGDFDVVEPVAVLDGEVSEEELDALEEAAVMGVQLDGDSEESFVDQLEALQEQEEVIEKPASKNNKPSGFGA